MFTQHMFGSYSKRLGNADLGHLFLMLYFTDKVDAAAFSVGCYCAAAP